MISLKKVCLLVVYVEVAYARILCLLRINKSTSPIPEGLYCYVWDEEKNKKEPINGYWTKPCKYYRSLKRQCFAGCTYVGFIGWDVCLGDQCKICGEKEE